MSSQFGAGTLVEYAGAQWRVLRALGVEAVLLRSDTGEEVAADPLKLQRPATAAPASSPVLTINEMRYSEADWAEATRRRDLLRTLAATPSRTTADVAGAAAALGLTPRRVWGLLRRSRLLGDEVARFLPSRPERRRTRLMPAAEAVIQQAIDQHYAKRTRPSFQSLVDEIAGRSRAANVAAPSPKGVKARVRTRNQAWLAAGRVRPRPARSGC